MCATPEGPGLNELLTVVCVVLLLTPCGMSAPTDRPMIWVDPCGGVEAPDGNRSERRPDMEILTAIRITAKAALTYANSFAPNYAQKSFGSDLFSVNQSWNHVRKQWLLPVKSYGEKTSRLHLRDLHELGLGQTLLKTYRYLQTIAVGLEQVYLDQLRNGETFVEEFDSVQHKLKLVLCEVQTGLLEIAPELQIEDVGREAMPDEERNLPSEAFRRARDWIIFRDCMSCLEYVIEVCQFFQDQFKTSHPPSMVIL